MNSREKVLRLRRWLVSRKPEDEGSAQLLQLLASISPALARMLPEDPAEIDRYLRTVAFGAVICRSDDAPLLRLHEWDGEKWVPVEFEEEAAGDPAGEE